MQTTHIDLQMDLVIIGLPLRTSPAAATQDIPRHWQRFMAEGGASKVTEGTPPAYVYAVYCDYDSDCTGAYTMVLGVAVARDTKVPVDMRRVRVPTGKYASFAVRGDPSDVIWKTWAHVNSDWPERAHRRYIADFERYDARSMATASVEAEIVVGLG